MTDQLWSAAAILNLAFGQSLAAEPNGLAERVGLQEQLCQTICNHFCEHSQAAQAIAAIQQGQTAALTRLEVYLQDAMEEHPNFLITLQDLAQKLERARPGTESRLEQTIRNNGQGFQTKVEGGKAYIGDDLYITDNSNVGFQSATVQGNVYNFFGKPHSPLPRSPQSSSNGSTPAPPHNIPRSDVTFVDRKEEVKRLHQLLQQYDLVVITNGVNLDGLGKTELAAQYSRKHLADYPGGICWLYPDRTDLGAQLVGFVRGCFTQVKIPATLPLADQVMRCWQNWQAGQVLLVVDNITSYDQIQPYLPSDSRFKVLITASSSVKFPIQRSQHLPLPGLPPDAALELLAALIGEDQVQQEQAFAEQLCAFVGYAPRGLHTLAHCRKPEVSYAS